MAEIFAELVTSTSGLILNDNAVACRSGIAAGTTVDVGDEVLLGGIFARVTFTLRKERVRSGGNHAWKRVYNGERLATIWKIDF